MEKLVQRPRSYGAYSADIMKLARKNASRGKPLDIKLDVVFKRVFSGSDDDSRNALKSLLSACIHRKVSRVQILNTELLPEYQDGKTIRLDVHAGVETLSPEEKWCIYFRYQHDRGKAELIKELSGKDGGIMSAEKVLHKVSRDYEEWAKVLFREKAEMDYQSGIYSARQEALKENRQKVRAAKQEVRVAKHEAQAIEQRAEEYRRQLEEAQAKLREAGL
jgi:hypothetical protein